ncbi:MAG: hypothetical protein EXR69_03670 [Myxococcales bacterium]|nr:hypothetical protein [Myxococcales bacterium]
MPWVLLILLRPAWADDDPNDPLGGVATDSTVTPDARGPSLAGGSLTGSEDLRIRYTHVPDKLVDFEDRDILDYMEVVNRLHLTGGNARFTLSLSGDAVALFGNRYILDGELHHERALYTDLKSPFADALFQMEKITAVGRVKAGTLTLGDSYASFGRGIAVNLNKNTDIDIDTSVRGASGLLHVGRVDASVFSGVTNPQQIALENPNSGLHRGREHAITGARFDVYGLGPVNLGAHGVMYQFARDADATGNSLAAYGQPVDAVVGGVTLEALGIGGVDFYVEGDWFGYAAADLSAPWGGEVYASASAYPGVATVLVEAKVQKNTEVLNTFASPDNYEIAAGPTLEYERVITEDSSAAVNSNDLAGGRVRVDLRLGEGVDTLTPYISQAVFHDGETGGLHFNVTPENITHTVVGVTWAKGESHLILNGGFRLDQREADEAGGDYGGDRLVHADASLTLPIAGPVSIEIAPAMQAFHWGTNPQQQSDYLDFSGTLAVKIGERLTVLFYNDYSSNPLVKSKGNLEPLGLGEDEYGALELQYEPTTAVTLKAFYGAYRAGIRCAGGQCRQLPGFNGARGSVSAAF